VHKKIRKNYSHFPLFANLNSVLIIYKDILRYQCFADKCLTLKLQWRRWHIFYDLEHTQVSFWECEVVLSNHHYYLLFISFPMFFLSALCFFYIVPSNWCLNFIFRRTSLFQNTIGKESNRHIYNSQPTVCLHHNVKTPTSVKPYHPTSSLSTNSAYSSTCKSISRILQRW
jgi:hypothetical protein